MSEDLDRLERHLAACHAEYERLLRAGKWPFPPLTDSTPDQDLLESDHPSETV